MIGNLENSIKKSLEKYELPYDSRAWEAMSKRLDQQQPNATKKLSTQSKFFIYSAVAVILGTAALLIWNKQEDKIVETEPIFSTQKSNYVDTESPKIVSNKQNTINSIKKQSEEKVYNIEKYQRIETPKDVQRENVLKQENVAFQEHPVKNPENLNGSQSNSFENKLNPSIPAVQNYCFGESITLNNSNDYDLYISDIQNNKTKIKANGKTKYLSKNDGIQTIGYYQNDQFIEIGQFNVYSGPKIDFEITEIQAFENGLPVTEFRASNDFSNLTWAIENNNIVNGNVAKAFFYKKGTYNVTLKATNNDGCTSETTKKVQIPEDYNLRAVKAINPNSKDPKNNTFMPYALTERNVDFKMQIIDPTNGQIIFESTEVSNPWTGIDSKTGQMVGNRTFIWKVNLRNPNAGEPSEYVGTIIKL